MIAGLVLLAGGAAAGVFGSLLGLGGGVLIVPLLTLGFGRPLREAVAVSLLCVIVTSSAAAGAYLRSRVANLRLGTVLALFTASGALVGALVAFVIPERVLAGMFALLLAYVALSMGRAGLAASRPARPNLPLTSMGPTRASWGPAPPNRPSRVRSRSLRATWTDRTIAFGDSCPRRSPRWGRASLPRSWASEGV